MPHIVVKMYPGKSDEEKSRIAEAIAEAVMTSAGSSEAAVSVSIVDVAPEVWAETVYRPDIHDRPDILYRKPGYNPL